MFNKLFNIIKRGIITLSSNDIADFPTVQVTYLGKTKNVELVLPYGLYSNPKEQSIALLLSVNGQEENISAIPYNPYTRFKDLKAGEVAVGNPHTTSKVYFKANGDIEIESAGNINITSTSSVNINGNSEPLVRGTALTTLFNSHTHTETGAVTGVPNQPMGITEVSTKNFTE